MTPTETSNEALPSADSLRLYWKFARHFFGKTISVGILIVSSFAYTFSAMPSTVHFYRSIIPPLEAATRADDAAKKSTPTAEALRTTNEAINVSQVYAVPSLLAMLEIISIVLAIEFWRLLRQGGTRSPLPILSLFICCQTYPFISVVFQIADTHRAALKNSHVDSAKNDAELANSLDQDIRAENSQLSDLYRQRTNLLSKRSNAAITAALDSIDARVRKLETKIQDMQNKRNGIREGISTKSSSLAHHSPIAYWLDDPFSREMLTGYFLAALFPVMLLSLGYFRARDILTTSG